MKTFNEEALTCEIESDLKFLKLLAKQYPTINAACTEIINLQAILNLPKGTEHFLTDIHGEYEPFVHVLNNASGVVKRKIDDIFGNSLRQSEKKSLATLIYYPEHKLEIVKKEESNISDWYKITLFRLIDVCRYVSSKYTRSKVRKALPKDFEYIIEELLHEEPDRLDKQEYYTEIIKTIIKTDRADQFIIALSKLIQRLVVDRLHIIGDIFDRGPGSDIIIEKLIDYHSVDIQWGNHDIVWMGAAAGSEACIATVLRISARYANLDIIEESYGINMLPLATFAMEFYGDDPCGKFMPKNENLKEYSDRDIVLLSKMHKAIAIIQFKLEGEIINRRKHFNMQDRLLLNKIDYKNGTIELNGKIYSLSDSNFPTIDKSDPYKLTKEESELVDRLKLAFLNSEKLQKHISFMYAKGSMYLRCNTNVLYHGCVPLDDNGNFKSVKISGNEYRGKALLDRFDLLAREGYFYKNNPQSKAYGMDVLWYLWTGPYSPLFGKDKMTTFERYFIDDAEMHKEMKNAYYKYRDDEEVVNRIIEEFNLDIKESHVINGHIPVETIKGESPIKAGGKLLVIDGGFSKSYQGKTGIAGYTLIFNSYGLFLVSHEPFESTQKAIEEEKDILSSTVVLEKVVERKRVGDTDIGGELKTQIEDLEMLLYAYRKGLIKEIR